MLSDADFGALCRRLYLRLKEGAVDPEAALSLARELLRDDPLDRDAAGLARLCASDATDPARLAEATRDLLADCFDPGFAEEPGWLAALEEALEIVKRDMRACGLPWTGHLSVHDGNAFAEVGDGYRSVGSGCYPESGSDPVTALVTVADDVQEAVMLAILGAWPVCPVHCLGTHPQERDGAAVWWCSGGDGHVAAPIGQWPAAWQERQDRDPGTGPAA